MLKKLKLNSSMKTYKTFKTNTPKRCPFHYRVLECKNRKSRNTWSNRQIWLWSTEGSRGKASRVFQENTLVISNTLFQQYKRRLYTWTTPDGQQQNQIDYQISCSLYPDPQKPWDALFLVLVVICYPVIDNWRRKWQPTRVFLPGKSHGWGSLAGYNPWGRK